MLLIKVLLLSAFVLTVNIVPPLHAQQKTDFGYRLPNSVLQEIEKRLLPGDKICRGNKFFTHSMVESMNVIRLPSKDKKTYTEVPICTYRVYSCQGATTLTATNQRYQKAMPVIQFDSVWW